MKIYFAGPLFNQAERDYNLKLTSILEAKGYAVFLPQRDGVEKNKPEYANLTVEKRRQMMFELDRDNILSADVFLFILDGRVPDEGACVELGIAYMDKQIHLQKYLIGMSTDSRAAFLGGRFNPMISQALDSIVDNEHALLRVLQNLN